MKEANGNSQPATPGHQRYCVCAECQYRYRVVDLPRHHQLGLFACRGEWVVYVGSNNGVVSAYGLKKDREKKQAASERPGLKMLHADFNLKVSQPIATPAGSR